LEYVLKKFRRQITKAGLFQDMKRKRFYESPGALRRRKTSSGTPQGEVRTTSRTTLSQEYSKMARITVS